MDGVSLDALVAEQLAKAAEAPAGRSAHTLFGGREHKLRQTVVVLTAGGRLNEHVSPGAATLQVLRGRVQLHAGEDSWEGAAGDYVLIPPQRHDLEALEDAAVLLTVGLAG